ncbi:hypothetical protein BSKO_11033 [Bryopsis sp. KO-2023]|nr:hypothetical protein BSKO_11033 [Bryopsis sp. KO-2023]
MKVPPYSEFSKACIELLYGARYGGVYQYDRRLKTSAKTTDGWTFASTYVAKEEGASCEVKAACSRGAFSVESIASSSSQLSVKASVAAPNLKGFVSAAFPHQVPARTGVEYSSTKFNVKLATELARRPILDFSASCGHRGAQIGGEMSLDSIRMYSLARWSMGVGYTCTDFQVCAYLMDLGRTTKLTYSHKLDSRSMLGLQVTKPLVAHNGWETTTTVGYSRRLENGHLLKGKVNTHGIVAMLWEGWIFERGGKVALSGQFDLTDLNKLPKFGVSLDLGR